MEQQKKNVRSILFMDDDHDEYDLVKEAIQEINPSISVKYVNSCDQLLQYRHQTFDLILLDINMPHHDGFFVLKSIRKYGYHELPIIMYSNSLSPAHIAKSYEEGANLYFAKPESFSSLLKGLRKLINLDWASPFSVTKTYCQDGNYRIFHAD
jgi:DNA-binding response OmpR family regulator